ncbi:MAG: DUF3502 domain-containing protein [Oscillospiraceae bacterium]|nr:DUF3502 domain-containing protein [Oscillospiraceae bacterium]
MKKTLALLLVLLTVLSLFAGCKTDAPAVSNDKPATDNKPAENTTSSSDLEYCELTFFLMGEYPGDKDVVLEAVNEKLMEKFNCTLDVYQPTWTDWQVKFQNELTAETIDLAYTASWGNYVIYANSGAFLELDDILPSAAPDLYNAVLPQLDMMRVNGTIYAVPNLWPEYECKGVLYRKDYCDDFDLPLPNSLENIEEYLLGILENDPGQDLLRYRPAEPGTTVGNYIGYFDVFNIKYDWISLGYGLWFHHSDPKDAVDYWYSQDFIDDCKLMKKWCDLGFWSRSTLNEEALDKPVENKLTVINWSGQNPNKYCEGVTLAKTVDPSMVLDYFAYGEVNGYDAVYPAHARQNATAIAASCKNPERALMVVEYILLDEEMHNLMHYGIEGVHYELRDGIYYNLSSESPPPFKYEGFNTWNLRNGDFKLKDESGPILQSVFDRLDPIAAKNKYPRVNIESGFQEQYDTEDYDYAAERNAVMNVMYEKLTPIQAGLVPDVEAAIADFLKAVEAAGLDVCRENYLAQWEAYIKEFGYDK